MPSTNNPSISAAAYALATTMRQALTDNGFALSSNFADLCAVPPCLHFDAIHADGITCHHITIENETIAPE